MGDIKNEKAEFQRLIRTIQAQPTISATKLKKTHQFKHSLLATYYMTAKRKALYNEPLF